VLGLALDGGDHDLARAAAERIAGVNAAPGTGSLTVATMLLKRQDLLSAANELETLLEAHPAHARARLMLGGILAQVERHAEAEAHLRVIPVSGPHGPDALHLMAQMALAQGKTDAAVDLLEQARARRPEKARYAVDHARALRSLGRNEEALTLLTQGIDRWPRHADLRFVRAMTMFDLGDADGAIWAMHEVLDVDPDHPGALNFIGFTWAEEGKKLPEAERMIRAALRQRPEDPAIIDSLGWVLYRQGEAGAARQILNRAVQLDPASAEIRMHLAICLWALGERKAAQTEYKIALDKTPDTQKDALKARWRQVTSAR
jgi:tetratricopeptide (TPR) repeat protein